MAAICVLLASADGCSMGKADRWSLDRYRDQRAVEIEQHLDRGEPIVKSPF